MKNLSVEDLKKLIIERKAHENSAIQINDSEINLVNIPINKTVLAENQVSLHECVFWFSGNFNHEKLEQVVSDINCLLKNF